MIRINDITQKCLCFTSTKTKKDYNLTKTCF